MSVVPLSNINVSLHARAPSESAFVLHPQPSNSHTTITWWAKLFLGQVQCLRYNMVGGNESHPSGGPHKRREEKTRVETCESLPRRLGEDKSAVALGNPDKLEGEKAPEKPGSRLWNCPSH